ncbi:hypothetical protein DPMN_118574 [Dreissena polymorpha]|uniref:Uncharacterized protein n=1 Tax=Dreissena polymorpha TaxID=45954 RepID=A0A9D4GKC7_DREPO|nr:hypothetical protein DPMN_118574 [Dreissena polymorpha]
MSLACRKPPAHRRQSNRLSVNVHESFFTLPTLRTSDLMQQFNQTTGRQTTIHLLGDETFPSGNDTLAHTGNSIPKVVSYRSKTGTSCPWHFVLNYNKRRMPQVLVEAKYNCKHCIEGGKTTRCVGIKFYHKVLFPDRCTSGEYRCTEALEGVSVGCTCVTGG